MFKFVLQDYRAEFRNSVKRLNGTGYFIYLYLLVFPPLWLHLSFWEELLYYAYFVPLGLGNVLSRLYPNQMSKTLLLCPLSAWQKKQYLLTGYAIRVAAPTILFALLEGAGLLAAYRQQAVPGTDLWLAGGLLWFFLVTMISVNIYRTPVPSSGSAAKRTYDLPGNYDVWNVFVQLVSIFGGMVLVSALSDVRAERRWEILLELVILLVQTALGIKMIVTYARPVMQHAIRYEYRPLDRQKGGRDENYR